MYGMNTRHPSTYQFTIRPSCNVHAQSTSSSAKHGEPNSTPASNDNCGINNYPAPSTFDLC
ncbi:hypothetical protein BDV93DRAFT_529989 [Ceratobasidium sp. AG-I]|nr:hypothetical protein BDV93DRAFT_529989 [Ceratobasidium sp. AG-I]